jgi:hypothetical protein
VKWLYSSPHVVILTIRCRLNELDKVSYINVFCTGYQDCIDTLCCWVEEDLGEFTSGTLSTVPFWSFHQAV